MKDWVKQTIATVGENIEVKRFARFNVGEGLEKRGHDFSAAAVAQTAVKPVPTALHQQKSNLLLQIPRKQSKSKILILFKFSY